MNVVHYFFMHNMHVLRVHYLVVIMWQILFVVITMRNERTRKMFLCIIEERNEIIILSHVSVYFVPLATCNNYCLYTRIVMVFNHLIPRKSWKSQLLFQLTISVFTSRKRFEPLQKISIITKKIWKFDWRTETQLNI